MSDNKKVCIVGHGGLARMAFEAMAKAGIVVEVVSTKDTLTKAEKTLEITRMPTFEDYFIEPEPLPGTKKWRREQNKKRF